VGAIIATYGRQGAVDRLAGLKRNAQLYQRDESVVAAVNRGDVATGAINPLLLVSPAPGTRRG
jgi:iron(III) transport system substrate-binding protein